MYNIWRHLLLKYTITNIGYINLISILEYMYFEILSLVNFWSITPDFSYTVYQSFHSDPSAIAAIIIELSHADLANQKKKISTKRKLNHDGFIVACMMKNLQGRIKMFGPAIFEVYVKKWKRIDQNWELKRFEPAAFVVGQLDRFQTGLEWLGTRMYQPSISLPYLSVH